MKIPRLGTVPFYFFVVVLFAGTQLGAQDKKMVKQALSYKPVQRNVSYDIPAKAELDGCSIEKTIGKFEKPGFAVYDASGRLLRLFFDINGDDDLDYWAYFKDGIEVYRDIDTDYDGRADEFRWMGPAGTRHGKDLDNNNTIDRWLKISASEAAEEVFRALQTTDTARFRRLLISGNELKTLKLQPSLSKTITSAVRGASSKFESFAKSQRSVNRRSRWTQFGSTRPSLVPKSNAGVTKDLIIFDHAAAVFENSGKFGQLSLGTIVEVSPNNWRLLELPQLVDEGQVVQNGGLFYQDSLQTAPQNDVAGNGAAPQTQKLVQLFEEYDSLSKRMQNARRPAEIAKLEQQQAQLFMELAEHSNEPQEKRNWVRQMADSITSAVQEDRFPKGLSFIKKQMPKIKAMGLSDEVAYAQWRILNTEFLQGHLSEKRNDREAANEKYIEDLEDFVNRYKKHEFTAEALFQLGLNAEVSQRDNGKTAVAWYRRCSKDFGNTVFGQKSAGAATRLSSVGKKLPFKGKTFGGRRFALQASQFRGKIVVIHFWETGCETCLDEFEELQRLGAKHKKDLLIVGANLDGSQAAAKRFLQSNRSVNWPQLFAEGGPEKSPLALQLGVTTLPMAMLVDQRGRLVEGNIAVNDLDREIQRLVRRESKQAGLRKSTR